jgi:dihydroorotase-like cyclic amidohydrolase
MIKHKKRRSAKLALQPETLCALETGRLEAVAGGLTTAMPAPSPVPPPDWPK